jgi:hypothetical protein
MAQFSYFCFRELHRLSGPGAADLQEPVDDAVYVEVCHFNLIMI